MDYVVIFVFVILMLFFWFHMTKEAFNHTKKCAKRFFNKEPEFKSVLYDRLFNDDGSWVLKGVNSSVPLSQDKTEYILNNYEYDVINDDALNSVMVYYPDDGNKLHHFIMSIITLVFVLAIWSTAIPYIIYVLYFS